MCRVLVNECTPVQRDMYLWRLALRRLQVTLRQSVPVNIPGVNEVLQLTVVPDARYDGVGQTSPELCQVEDISFRRVGVPSVCSVGYLYSYINQLSTVASFDDQIGVPETAPVSG